MALALIVKRLPAASIDLPIPRAIRGRELVPAERPHSSLGLGIAAERLVAPRRQDITGGRDIESCRINASAVYTTTTAWNRSRPEFLRSTAFERLKQTKFRASESLLQTLLA